MIEIYRRRSAGEMNSAAAGGGLSGGFVVVCGGAVSAARRSDRMVWFDTTRTPPCCLPENLTYAPVPSLGWASQCIRSCLFARRASGDRACALASFCSLWNTWIFVVHQPQALLRLIFIFAVHDAPFRADILAFTSS